VWKKYRLITNLNEAKQDLIFIKIENEIISKYEYYRNYNSQNAKFSTYLYKDILYTTIKILREENLKKEYYSLSKTLYLQKISKKEINPSLAAILLENDNIFQSKKEIEKWINQKHFTVDEKEEIIKLIKRKELYTDRFLSYEDQENYIKKEECDFSLHDSKIFLDDLNKIEKKPIFRLVLKIMLNININYLNPDIVELHEIPVELGFIESIKLLYNQTWANNKGFFFR
jgi:hypothetical protein